ncbi:MAG TPA: hypothetical protein VN193_08235 [Candidatus Angelobacter sp.]|jgi:hypothetical protein|nr:hypothetical protein [Candidatus Angelobacter sp.]
MPNRFTAVPSRPVPPLPAAGRALLPLADGFMLVMLSRPQSGSLRDTWVTPATLWMCAALAVVGAAAGALALTAGGTTPWLIAGIVAIALAAGGAAVATVGAMQRRA